jgi:hypothetical protein
MGNDRLNARNNDFYGPISSPCRLNYSGKSFITYHTPRRLWRNSIYSRNA